MYKIFTFLILLILSCSSVKEITTDDLRKCNIKENLIKDGIVKEYTFSNKDGEFKFYDVIKKKDSSISLERFDSFLRLIRKDIFKIESDCWTIDKMYFFDENKNKNSVEIIIPSKYSFDPNDKILNSKIKYNPSTNIEIVISGVSELVGFDKVNILDEELNCIRFDTKVTTVIQIQGNLDETKISDGFSLFGEGLGWVYSKNIEDGDTVIYKMTKLISIDEFKKNKQ